MMRRSYNFGLLQSLLLSIAAAAATAAFVVVPSSSSATDYSFGTARKKKTSSALNMVQNRGLEIRQESATPTEGGMTLYVKAGPDGKSLGDCPFAHFVGMVLQEKNLDYTVQPCIQETKPQWLIDYYEGKMPALRHRKECYVESSVIADYLEFFFPDPSLQTNLESNEENADPTVGFFPTVARYLKNVDTEGDVEQERLEQLQEALTKLNDHFLAKEENTGTESSSSSSGLFLEGYDQITLKDCSLAPQLYHLSIGIKEFKNNVPNLSQDYPAVQKYMDTIFARPSFMKTLYPPETVVWGWSNARSK